MLTAKLKIHSGYTPFQGTIYFNVIGNIYVIFRNSSQRKVHDKDREAQGEACSNPSKCPWRQRHLLPITTGTIK